MHLGMMHQHASSPEPPAKRVRVAEAPPPCPPFNAADWEDGEDGVADLPDLDPESSDDEEEEEEEEEVSPEEREALLAQIRLQARHLLEQPGWRKWASEMLDWAEENLLNHMEDMFPEAGHFETRETFRFLQLRSMHPGASFAKELLAAAQEEPLDLAKVCAAFPICDLIYARHMPGICQAYAWNGMHYGVYTWHFTGLLCPPPWQFC